MDKVPIHDIQVDVILTVVPNVVHERHFSIDEGVVGILPVIVRNLFDFRGILVSNIRVLLLPIEVEAIFHVDAKIGRVPSNGVVARFLAVVLLSDIGSVGNFREEIVILKDNRIEVIGGIVSNVNTNIICLTHTIPPNEGVTVLMEEKTPVINVDFKGTNVFNFLGLIIDEVLRMVSVANDLSEKADVKGL